MRKIRPSQAAARISGQGPRASARYPLLRHAFQPTSRPVQTAAPLRAVEDVEREPWANTREQPARRALPSPARDGWRDTRDVPPLSGLDKLEHAYRALTGPANLCRPFGPRARRPSDDSASAAKERPLVRL